MIAVPPILSHCELEIEPRVGTPTWECPLPREIVKKSHFPLWVSRGTQVWDPTQYLTEWVIKSSLLRRKSPRVGQNDVFLVYDAHKYSMKDVPLTLVSETHDHNKNVCRFKDNIGNFPREPQNHENTHASRGYRSGFHSRKHPRRTSKIAKCPPHAWYFLTPTLLAPTSGSSSN